MGLGVSGYISDSPCGRHSEVGQQTRNHILQTSPPGVACHEALLLPQLLVVCWWVEFSSDEQVQPPVCVHTVQLIRFIAVMYVCVNYYSNTEFLLL